MTQSNLKNSTIVDLSTVELNFEGFRELAENPHLSPNERIGFPDSYRVGFDGLIFDDICTKLALLEQNDRIVVDIGPGCANIPRMMMDACRARGHRLVLVDSEEMLAHLPDCDHVIKVAGPYPATIADVKLAAGGKIDALLCYSVLHYLFVDTNLFDVIDQTIGILQSPGRALFGDIPNVSKRKRFFGSAAGVRYHQSFTNTQTFPCVEYGSPEPGKIDDSVLLGMMQRAQLAGCDAYLLPQPDALPMANRRDDLLIRRP